MRSQILWGDFSRPRKRSHVAEECIPETWSARWLRLRRLEYLRRLSDCAEIMGRGHWDGHLRNRSIVVLPTLPLLLKAAEVQVLKVLFESLLWRRLSHVERPTWRGIPWRIRVKNRSSLRFERI